MSTVLTVNNPTLLDLRLRMDQNGNIARIIENLNQKNPMVQAVPFIEANGVTNHVTTVRTGIPAPTWTRIYQGVQPTKSTTVQVTDSMGTMEMYSEVAARLVTLSGDGPAFRRSEDIAHIEGLNQEWAQTFIYGNEGTAPAEFTGLAPRMNSTTAENGDHVIKAGGSGADNTSVYLCVMGEWTGHMIYPRGSQAGWVMEDKGQTTSENIDGAGGRGEIWRTYFKWDVGFTMRDWRYFARVCNIDVSDLTKNASAGADLIDLLTQAIEIVQDLESGRAFFLANRTITSFLRRQVMNKIASSTLTLEQAQSGGRKILHFDDIPVYRTDAIVNNESLVA